MCGVQACLNLKNQIHRRAAFMRFVGRVPVIDKWRGLATRQLFIPLEQVNADTPFDVVNDLLAPRTRWGRCILALPVKVPIVDPVIQAAMLGRLALFAQFDQKQTNQFVLEVDVHRMPLSQNEFFTKKCTGKCSRLACLPDVDKIQAA